jgi:hypothetical protein
VQQHGRNDHDVARIEGVDRALHSDRHATGQLQWAHPLADDLDLERLRTGVRQAHERERIHHIVDAGQRGDHRIGQRNQADMKAAMMRTRSGVGRWSGHGA